MEYISHEDYKKMLGSFGKKAPKAQLNEGLEKEGNAFTAGLAKTKKGGEFEVGGKKFKDKTNYDASLKEDNTKLETVFSKYSTLLSKALDIRAKNKEDIDAHDAVKRILETIAKELGLKSDHPYMEDEMFSGNTSPEEAVAYAKEMFTSELEDSQLDEYQFDQMYPDDPGPFEGKDEMEETIKEFLAKESAVNWERVDDEEAESDETDNGIEEGLNPAPFQATGPTIQTVEGKHSNLAHLTTEEKDQLRQYIETIKTVKEQIQKMVGKGEVEEGGDNTNLIMKTSTVSEGDDEESEP
jgi:hypothetical protein